MGNAKVDLYSYVDKIRESFNITLQDYPLSVIDICNTISNLDIYYRDFTSHGFCGTVLMGDKQDTIILNSQRSAREMNFDCAHEAIHLTRHRDKGINSFTCMEQKTYLGSEISFFEWEANEGAAELLVPLRRFLPLIKNNISWIKKPNDVTCFKKTLSQIFNVTEAVITFRFESLKYEIIQYLHGAVYHELEILSHTEQMRRNIQVDSMNEKGIESLHKHVKIQFPLDFSDIDVFDNIRTS